MYNSSEKGLVSFKDLKQKPTVTVSNYDLNWDNVLLLSPVGSRTFAFLSDGECIYIDKPIKAVLNEFSEKNGCYRQMTVPLYSYYKVNRPTKSLISGNNVLVPNLGSCNPDLVYYMVKPLVSKHYDDTCQELVLKYMVNGNYLYIGIPAYKNRTLKILKLAEKISRMHIRLTYARLVLYKIQHDPANFSHVTACEKDLIQLFKDVRKEEVHFLIKNAYNKVYGDEPDEEFLKAIDEGLLETERW